MSPSIDDVATPDTSSPNRPAPDPSVEPIRPRIGVNTTSAALASPPRTHLSTLPAASRTPSASSWTPDLMSSLQSPNQPPMPPCGGGDVEKAPCTGLLDCPASIP